MKQPFAPNARKKTKRSTRPKTRPARGKNPAQAKKGRRVKNEWPHAAGSFQVIDATDILVHPHIPEKARRHAESQYQAFSHLPAQRWIVGRVNFPDRLVQYGHAEAVGYRSNKFDGVWRDYIHAHGALHPEIWVAGKGKGSRKWPKREQPKVFSFLGFLLDLQYYRDLFDPVGFYKFNFPRRGAFLCGDGVSHRLYVIPENANDGSVFIIESPDLRIYPEGIVN